MNNRYFYGSHLKERKFRKIVRLFSLDIEAKKTAKMTGVSRQSINKIYAAIRQRIVEICEEKQPPSLGEFELDESYFGARHSDNEFAKENNIHTNTIENFWGLCKSRLFKFRGVNKNAFYTHLKECEFGYNNRDKNLYKMLLKNFRKNPLK